MLDFEKIAELSFVTMELNETVRLENGMIITRDNVCEFINNVFDT